MILIKDRHDKVSSNPISLNILGKYDTYKGSTLELNSSFSSSFRQGNMILIKDRHFKSP